MITNRSEQLVAQYKVIVLVDINNNKKADSAAKPVVSNGTRKKEKLLNVANKFCSVCSSYNFL